MYILYMSVCLLVLQLYTVNPLTPQEVHCFELKLCIQFVQHFQAHKLSVKHNLPVIVLTMEMDSSYWLTVMHFVISYQEKRQKWYKNTDNVGFKIKHVRAHFTYLGKVLVKHTCHCRLRKQFLQHVMCTAWDYFFKKRLDCYHYPPLS